MEQFSEEQDRLKYERDGKDLIAEWAEIHYKVGVIACIAQLQAYFRRYTSTAEKAGNEADISKGIKYLNRTKGILPDRHPNYVYLLQLEYAIKNRKFENIDNLCYQILSTILI